MTAIDPYAQPEYGRGTATDPEILPQVNLTVPDLLTTVPYNVTWTYTHPEGRPQTEYRVVIVKAGVQVYSSGWVASAATSHQIAGPHGLDDSTADIYLTAAAQHRGYQDTDFKTVTTEFGKPSITWLHPDPVVGVISETFVEGEWGYVDTRSKAQAQYRVILLHASELAFDSGWLGGAATTYEVPYLLSPGSSYELGVKVRNTNQVESG